MSVMLNFSSCTIDHTYITQESLEYGLLSVLSRKDVEEDGHVEQGCPGNDEVVEVGTGQLHHSENGMNQEPITRSVQLR